MKKIKSTPGIQKAFDFVREGLEKGKWQTGSRLPPVRALANEAGVSFVTMIKAIAALKSAGHVHGIPRGPIRAGASASVTHPSLADSAIWRMKRTALEKDILAGTFAHQGALPSFKELQARYGVCFTTMRKILRSMLDDGVLSLNGKTYELRSYTVRPFRQRMVFIPSFFQDDIQSSLNQGQYRLLDLFEHECFRRQLKLEFVKVDFYNEAEAGRIAVSPEITESSLGAVIDMWNQMTESSMPAFITFLSGLASLKRPVAIIDEIGNFILPAQFSANPLIQVFRVQGKGAGARIARVLLGMGHEKVVFVNPYEAEFWSEQRFDGILEQYNKAGCGSGVYRAANASLNLLNYYRLQLFERAGFDTPMLRKVIAVDYTPQQAEDHFNNYLQYQKNGLPDFPGDEDFKDIINNLAGLLPYARGNHAPDFFDRVFRGALWASGLRIYAAMVRPLFEKALSYSDASAWICATDGLAFAALEFLRAQNIPVPGKLSLTGFDNAPLETPEQRLTSFDFNAQGFVHRSLDFLARPPRMRGPYRHVPIEIEGIIMQRDTTASAGKGKKVIKAA
jgi:DNA-binding transcriptional regulator YhcF (GntR family)